MMKFFLLTLLSLFFIENSVNATVIAIHEHELKTEVSSENYEIEIAAVLKNLRIPGLLQAYHLKGFKGNRTGNYAIIWVFADAGVIEANFGTLDHPKWPKEWLFYENEVLSKYLVCHPDAIHFTDYELISGN